MPVDPRRRLDLVVFALLFLLLPAAMLGECAFLGRQYLPYDIAEYPPIGSSLLREQRDELRRTANYDATEPPIWFRVELQLAREALLRGQLPQWNPWVRGGAPMLAHGHLGFLNPLHWPALLFADPDTGLLCLTWTMFALAGALMYGLLRALALGPPAAAFGAIAFAWSGTLAANGHWFMRMEPIALLPGVLWAMLAVARRSGRERARPAALLALAVACTWLAGFPQYAIPATLLAAGLGAALVAREARAGFAPAARLCGWLALGGGLGLLLAMPQLAQQFAFYPLSNRPIDESLDRASRHALAPMALLGYLFPELFSHPGDTSLPTQASPLPWLWSDPRHWETGEQLLPNYNFTEYSVFPGTLPLVCAAFALLLRGPRWRVLVACALAGVWLLATGALGCWLAYLLPGFKVVPPYRFLGVGCALVAMLAAAGFEALRRDAAPWPLRGTALALAIAGALCLAASARPIPDPTPPDDPWIESIVERYREPAGREHGLPPAQVTAALARATLFGPSDAEGRRIDAVRNGRERLHASLRRGGFALLLGAGFVLLLSLRDRSRALCGWPAALAIAFTAVELFGLGWRLNRGQALPWPHDSEVHAFLRGRRDAAKDDGGFVVARGTGAFGVMNLPCGTLATEGIRDLNFYTFVDKESDRPVRRLYGERQILRGFAIGALPDDARLELPWWDLVGLRYVLATEPMQHAGRRVGPELRGAGREYFVYERPHAMPRAWTVPALHTVDTEEQVIDALVRPDFDPRAAAVVTRDQAALLDAKADPGSTARLASFAFDDGQNVVIEVAGGAEGYLVLADTFFPGWTATVDGRPTPIARGNLCQRVVALPPAPCRVHFSFETEGLATGLRLGGAAVAVLLVLLWVSRPQRGAAVAPPTAPPTGPSTAP